jgi:hypothetical protein
MTKGRSDPRPASPGRLDFQGIFGGEHIAGRGDAKSACDLALALGTEIECDL